MTRLRYGLLGAGMMGQEHMRNLRLLEEVELVAFMDTDESMANRAQLIEPRAERVNHMDDLLAQGLDALVVATPNFQHADQLLALAEQPNLAILCEKPICTQIGDVKRLAETFEGRSAPLWVGMEYRFMPAMQTFLGKCAGVGDKHLLSIREHRYPFLKKVNDWNRFNRFSGGTFVEKCCHFFDLMRLILDQEPVRVFATGGQACNHLDEHYPQGTPDILDHGLVIVEFDGGARATLDLCMFAEGAKFEQDISLTGDEARLDVHIPGPHPRQSESPAQINLYPRRSAAVHEIIELPSEIKAAGAHQGATYYAHQAFARTVKSGAPVEVTLRDGLLAVLMGMAAQASIRKGQAIAIDAVNLEVHDS